MKSFFDLQDSLNEGVESYSNQALGRKRNTMLRALTLDGAEFERWVHDRIIRFAEQNRIPLQQLDIGSFRSGFSEWQSALEQKDKNYGETKGQVSQYISKFMSVAPGIIARYQSGESAPVKEPLSPSMVPYETADSQAQPAEQPQEGEEGEVPPEPVYAKATPPFSPEEVQTQQQDVMNMLDMVDNPVANMGDVEQQLNGATFKSRVRNLADMIAQANGLENTDQLNYEMVNSYIGSLRDTLESNMGGDLAGLSSDDLDLWEELVKKEFVESYPGIIESQRERARRAQILTKRKMEEKSLRPEVSKTIGAQDAEIGLIAALERKMGQTFLSPTKSAAADKKFTTKSLQRTFMDIQADSLIEQYPFLKDASFKHIGSVRGKVSDSWKSHGQTANSSNTSKTDIQVTLSDGNFIRFDEESGAIIRCTMREVQESGMCTNRLNLSMKKGPSQLLSAREGEARAITETALTNLTKRGYDFSNPDSFANTLMTEQGLDPDTAAQKAQIIIQQVQSLRELTKKFFVGKTQQGKIGDYQVGGKLRESLDPNIRGMQETIDSTQVFMDQASEAITSLTENMPELIGEMAYLAATGEDKFEEGSDHIATHFLSLSDTDPSLGPKILPITRQFTNELVLKGGITGAVRWKTLSDKSSRKRVESHARKQGTSSGLEGDKLEDFVRTSSDNLTGYNVASVLRLFNPETNVQTEGVVYIGKFLVEDDNSQILDDVQGISPEAKKYTQEAVDWAFSNLENLTKFFDLEPDTSNVNLPDFGEDYINAYFKKDIEDEMQELGIL